MPQISEKISEKSQQSAKSRGSAWLFCAAIATVLLLGQGADRATAEPVRFVSLGEDATAPVGWVEFCDENPGECPDENTEPRDILFTPEVWKDLQRVNKWVNKAIEPMTDLAQWKREEKWSYPDTGRGDCEDYVLLKRQILIEAGWPREALLITVVREPNGNGHAVLTVKTDKGEFILDNQNEEILLWSETAYRFVKRQSQTNANVWVALGDLRPAPPMTATSR